MKKVFLMTMAALSILFTQCKKTEVTPVVTPTTENQVTISLNVGGSKVDVNPIQGTVDWEEGDIIYVASHGAYVGMLTYDAANTEFKGTIADPTVGEPLFFYYLGNQTPTSTPTVGTTTGLAVSIADQHEKFPVIAAGESNENYKSSVFNYTSTLRNKCGLVKFSVAGYTGTGDITVKKMNNKVTVDFSKNLGYGGFTYEKENGGAITLNKQGDVEYWAILLPQDEVTGIDGDAYSSDGWIGTFGTVPAINNNSYVTAGVEVTPPIGIGTFHVSPDKTVKFSPGLMYWDGSAFKFEADQTSYPSTWNANHVNHFYWQPYSRMANSYEIYYDCSDVSTSDVFFTNNQNIDDYANPNANFTVNGETGKWRTLTKDEWVYLLEERSGDNAPQIGSETDARYALVMVNNLFGMMIFPDVFTWPDGITQPTQFNGDNETWYDHNYTVNEFETLQSRGVVFLPAAGRRNEEDIDDVGSDCRYWSSSPMNDDEELAYDFFFCKPGYVYLPGENSREACGCVRLVR